MGGRPKTYIANAEDGNTGCQFWPVRNTARTYVSDFGGTVLSTPTHPWLATDVQLVPDSGVVNPGTGDDGAPSPNGCTYVDDARI